MEKYVTAEMEVIEFETEDVITTSGNGGSSHFPEYGVGSEEEEEGW